MIHSVVVRFHHSCTRGVTPFSRAVAAPQNHSSAIEPGAPRALNAAIAEAFVRVPWSIVLLGGNVRGLSSSRYKPELKTAYTSTDVDIMVIAFVVAMVV